MKIITVNDHIPCYLEQTNKFDTITFEFVFSQQLVEHHVAKRYLMSQLYIQALKDFPTMLMTKRYYAQLYNAKISTTAQKNGDTHEIIFQFSFLHPKYVPQDKMYSLETILGAIQAILRESLLVTKTNEDELSKLLIIEKENIQQRIKQLYDDKTFYAQLKLTEKMFSGTSFAIRSYGKIEDYTDLEIADVYQAQKQLWDEDELSVFIVGDVDAHFISHLSEILSIKQSNIKKQSRENNVFFQFMPEKLKVYSEKQQINQTKFHLGFHTPVTINEPGYLAHKLALDILGGGTPLAKLFQNVREKASLAYYITTILDTYAQAFYIYAGIDKKNIERTLSIIREQIIAMQEGMITQEEIQIAKLSQKRKILAALDTPTGTITLQKSLAQFAYINTIDAWFNAIELLEREHLIEAAQKWREHTLFVLVSSEKSESAGGGADDR